MRLRVDVAGEPAAADIGSLLADVRSVSGLSAVLLQTPPAPGELEASTESMTVGLTSRNLVPVLVRVVLTWLRRQAGSPAVAIAAEDGIRVEIRTTDTDREVEQLANLLNGSGLFVTGGLVHGNLAVGNGGHAFAVSSGDLHVFYGPEYLAAAGGGDRISEGSDFPDSMSLPITIYLSDEGAHGQVEAAVGDLLTVAGLRIEHREDPVFGSWFRRMRAGVGQAVRSSVAREGALIAAHVAHTRLVLAQDATVTATLMQNLGPVITSLQPTKDAVVRLGAVLIVKVDWVVTVYQLTAAQQAVLELQPKLAVSPHEIIAALNARPEEGSGPPALL